MGHAANMGRHTLKIIPLELMMASIQLTLKSGFYLQMQSISPMGKAKSSAIKNKKRQFDLYLSMARNCDRSEIETEILGLYLA